MQARLPDHSGYAVNDGVRVYYEVYGEGEPTLLLLPTWAIVHSRHWKMQIPYLARRYRVVTFDPRGNGRTDRPDDGACYTDETYASDAAAVLDATGTDSAVLVAHCSGVTWAMLLAVAQPDRVRGLVAISTNIKLAPSHAARRVHSFDAELDTDEGWAKQNQYYWLRDWPGYVDFFSGQMLPEPHSTKVLDDMVEWGRETDGTTMLRTVRGKSRDHRPDPEALCRALPCPVLVVSGDQDDIVPAARSERLAELTGAHLLMIEGGGHLPHARHPVVVNHAIREFVDTVALPPPRRTPWLFARNRKRRALWISSPIGLGHVLRDLAMARELRAQVPDLEIHWWAQPPVTQVLEQANEIVHPVSQEMASESAHWESEAAGHDLHAFYAFRRMDEIFCANYLLFDDVVRETPYDLWVGDECWEVDHFLHENPERKIAPYVFTTDVVGFLPVDPEGDPREVELCTDYNAEMIEHRARYPSLRDVSLFIGGYDELPDASLGAGLPGVREWTRDWFDSVPYVAPFDPFDYRDPAALRTALGHGTGYPLLVSAVGGTSVGRDVLDLVAEGFRYLRKEIPEARMLMVTGPRIDPREVPDVDGMDKRGYVHDLFRHLACADAAVVQGGLSTTMELVAARRPFVYFPIRNHWEQQHFVRHRLEHYRAGIPLEYAETTPPDLAGAMLQALSSNPRYRAVPRHGARVAAARIAPLLQHQRQWRGDSKHRS
ncbi:MAG: alpha/beta fold hydrolase [Nocardioidaceae bacterium]